MRVVKLFGLLLVLAAVALGAAYYVAGRAAAPTVSIIKPASFIGQKGSLEFTVAVPGARLTRLDVTLEQNGQTHALFQLDRPSNATMTQDGPDTIRIAQPIGKQAVPTLQPGRARLTIAVARPVLFGWRTRDAIATQEVEVRLTPPRLAVLSTHHYINHGGSEFIVYRVTPPTVESGVMVGDTFYRGFSAADAGLASDPTLRVAFFVLRHDEDLNSRIRLTASDEAENTAALDFDSRVFEKPFQRSRIEIDDRFLQRVVPAILDNTRDLTISASRPDEVLPAFLRINRELREKNAQQIAALAARTAPRMLWEGPFRQLTNSQVESRFADHRTYFYQGREIDQQVHLGFDLAVTANVPVLAANSGQVLFADYLGIYGNCVVVDHGLGVQSLYGHLSSFDVKAGDQVKKEQPLGRSGMTGLAGGDHLHFTMLVDGHAVTPVEWWDAHWIDDRVARKIRSISGGSEDPPPRN
jgi:murein DD-endopeptidase MepM/ murein hydrolase activator NlpD